VDRPIDFDAVIHYSEFSCLFCLHVSCFSTPEEKRLTAKNEPY